MKLTKQQIKAHEKCDALLQKDNLTYDEKLSIYENWYPAYGNQIGKIASFFTPISLANDFQLTVGGDSVVDLCAGIGILSFLHYHRMASWEGKECKVVCLERNADFVAVGQKLFPEATWITGDVLDRDIIMSLGKFDLAISNPPFGNIKSNTSCQWLKYKGSEFEYKVIEISGYLASSGSFIIPQGSCPFKYSGGQRYSRISTSKYDKFSKETGIEFDAAVGIDCDIYKGDWKGASPTVEIVDVSEYPIHEQYTKSEPPRTIQTELF
ncbi:methyltransferase [Chitinophaga sp. RCC_12]|uniref:methyltransferase n=1 Tax=Chitinophaga sp. RCC_12 TaxID=3239226 RepID=UPI003525B55E